MEEITGKDAAEDLTPAEIKTAIEALPPAHECGCAKRVAALEQIVTAIGLDVPGASETIEKWAKGAAADIKALKSRSNAGVETRLAALEEKAKSHWG